MGQEDRIRLPTLNLIHRRSRLLDRLDKFVEAGSRLITVYAPGGYGKSILLADFAQTTDLPVCWCSLEPADRDPTSFLSLLAYSITDRFHEIESNGLFDLIERGDTQNSIHRVADLLAGVGPHLIIVDDYHKAVSAGMTLALNRLLDQLPEDSTVIVAARGDMVLETGQIIDLLISERATGLSEEELRFTPEELRRVIRKRFGRRIDMADAEEIAQVTDGNIAQILLTGHVMHAEKMIGRLRQGLGDDREIIYSYLAEEVFSKQPPELQHFLLHTAVLPDMTAALCNDLLEITDAQVQIEELVHKDLFISQVGAGFRYHDLFADFLRTKLAEDKTHHREVCIKAANLLAKEGRYEEGVTLLLSVRAWDETAALLESRGTYFYDTGRALTLNTWLEQVSQEELNQHPRLLLLRGQILVMDMGEPKIAMGLFEHAEDLYRSRNDSIGAAEAQVWKSVGLRVMGQANSSLEFAETGLAQLERLNSGDQVVAWALNSRGLSHMKVGNTEDALVDFRQALGLFETLDDEYRTGNCHQNIGICLDVLGNINAANYHFKQALRIWEALGNANSLSNTLNSLGVSLMNVGRYDEALNYLNDSLDIALQIEATTGAAFAQAGIGDVYLARHDYQRATQAYTISAEFAKEAGVLSLEVFNMVRMGECMYQRHDLDRALSFASQAKEIATEAGLTFERGLAAVLQGRIYVRRAEYEASFNLFSEAVSSFSGNDVLELTKARLWWGNSLLLNLKSLAAREQLHEAIRLTLDMGELIQGLGSTVEGTKRFLLHFLHWPDTPEGMRASIRNLLDQASNQLYISSPSLQAFFLGTPYLVVSGKVRQFGQRGRTRKMPEFLACLLIEGQGSGCRWDQVGAKIWPDLESEKSSANFHQTLKRLRSAILEEAVYVVAQDDYYRVNPDYLEWCDALAFEQLYERAAKAAPGESLSLQLELISVYQGEFLAGFELSDWGDAIRASFEERFLQIVSLASEQLLRDGTSQTALAVIQRGLSQDYFREKLHRSAFRAYAQLGLFDQLEAHFSQVNQVFQQEFDAPLDPETTQLYERLLAGR
jgi:ATP/maltotriose-dependent transcriptional regulator MalT/DNA-binding SARP family transcriptional activator